MIPPIIKITGDREKGIGILKDVGMPMLAKLKEAMGFQNLQQLSLAPKILPDGSTVRVQSIFGVDIVTVDAVAPELAAISIRKEVYLILWYSEGEVAFLNKNTCDLLFHTTSSQLRVFALSESLFPSIETNDDYTALSLASHNHESAAQLSRFFYSSDPFYTRGRFGPPGVYWLDDVGHRVETADNRYPARRAAYTKNDAWIYDIYIQSGTIYATVREPDGAIHNESFVVPETVSGYPTGSWYWGGQIGCYPLTEQSYFNAPHSSEAVSSERVEGVFLNGFDVYSAATQTITEQTVKLVISGIVIRELNYQQTSSSYDSVDRVPDVDVTIEIAGGTVKNINRCLAWDHFEGDRVVAMIYEVVETTTTGTDNAVNQRATIENLDAVRVYTEERSIRSRYDLYLVILRDGGIIHHELLETGAEIQDSFLEEKTIGIYGSYMSASTSVFTASGDMAKTASVFLAEDRLYYSCSIYVPDESYNYDRFGTNRPFVDSFRNRKFDRRIVGNIDLQTMVKTQKEYRAEDMPTVRLEHEMAIGLFSPGEIQEEVTV